MDFLYILLYVLVPWTAINLIDYYLVQHGSLRHRLPYARRWRSVRAHPMGGPCCVISLVFAIEIPFMSQSLYTGPIAKWLGRGRHILGGLPRCDWSGLFTLSRSEGLPALVSVQPNVSASGSSQLL